MSEANILSIQPLVQYLFKSNELSNELSPCVNSCDSCDYRESMDECRSSTLDDVMRAVTMENIPFDFGAFLNMTPEGIDMLKGLLQRDPAKRLTARQAMNHPWFKLHAAYEETAKENGLQVGHRLTQSHLCLDSAACWPFQQQCHVALAKYQCQ